MQRAAVARLALLVACGATLAGCAEPLTPYQWEREKAAEASAKPHTGPAVVVAGEVNKPGWVNLPAEGNLTLIAALTAAGWTTANSSRQVYVARQQLDGRNSRYAYDVMRIIRGASRDALLQDGDQVMVKPAHAFSPDDAMPNLGAPWAVSVLGLVGKPGVVVTPPDQKLTLKQAIAQAGGLTLDAGAVVMITRKSVVNSTTRLFIVGDKIMPNTNRSPSAQSMNDYNLCDGDVITVEEGIAQTAADALAKAAAQNLTEPEAVHVLGEVNKPGWVALPKEKMTLVAAVNAAGGPTPRAAIMVAITRLQPDGTTKTFGVNLQRAMKGYDPDFPLQPDDSIMVGEMLIVGPYN